MMRVYVKLFDRLLCFHNGYVWQNHYAFKILKVMSEVIWVNCFHNDEGLCELLWVKSYSKQSLCFHNAEGYVPSCLTKIISYVLGFMWSCYYAFTMLSVSYVWISYAFIMMRIFEWKLLCFHNAMCKVIWEESYFHIIIAEGYVWGC